MKKVIRIQQAPTKKEQRDYRTAVLELKLQRAKANEITKTTPNTNPSKK